MVLEPGNYTIKAKEKDQYVGRSMVEDRSYGPKRILALVDPPETPEWKMESIGDGETFVMSTRNSYTAKIDDYVFAILTDNPGPTSWRVQPQFHMGDDTYIITCVGGEGVLAWTVPNANDDEEPQVAVKPLIVPPSFPRGFLPNQLFVITKVVY